MTDKCRHQQKHLRLSASICFNLRLKINNLKFVEFLFAASNSVGVDEKTSKFFDMMNYLDHYLLCENQAKRGVLQEKVWVLGTRTPALGGNVRPKGLRSWLRRLPLNWEARAVP